jgi:hypothetical protein
MSADRKSDPVEPAEPARSMSWQHARTTFDSFASMLGRVDHHRREDILSLGVYLVRLAGQRVVITDRRRLSQRPQNRAQGPKIEAEALIVEGEIARVLGELEKMFTGATA